MPRFGIQEAGRPPIWREWKSLLTFRRFALRREPLRRRPFPEPEGWEALTGMPVEIRSDHRFALALADNRRDRWGAGLRIGVETLRQWMMAEGYGSIAATNRRGRCTSHDDGGTAWAIWYRSMVRSMAGSRTAGSGARCWHSSTMRRAERASAVRASSSRSMISVVTKAYLETHGKPVAFYSDKHGIFRVNAKDATAPNAHAVWPGPVGVVDRHDLR